MEEYIKNVIYRDNQEKYNQLFLLNNKIKNTPHLKRPFLVEFLGTCRSEKSTSIEIICDVFRKNGLIVKVIDEEYIEWIKDINEDRT